MGNTRPTPHQVPALVALVPVVGRGIDIDQQFGAGSRRLCAGVLLPDVFTNAQPDAKSLNLQDTGLRAGGKVALLVEDLVIGQALLAILGEHLAPVQYRGHVIQVAPLETRITKDQVGLPLHRFAYLLQGLRYPVLNAGAQQQVFRRVTAQSQFRKYHQWPRALLLRSPHHLDNPGAITFKITHKSVDLRHQNIQAGHGTSGWLSGAGMYCRSSTQHFPARCLLN